MQSTTTTNDAAAAGIAADADVTVAEIATDAAAAGIASDAEAAGGGGGRKQTENILTQPGMS